MSSYVIGLLTGAKYFLLIPVIVLESNGTSLVIGFLSRIGMINPFVFGAFVVAVNLCGDIVLYWLGYYGGEKILGKWGRYIGVKEEMLEKMKTFYHTYKTRILFFSKVTNGLGFATLVLFTAGVTRIPFGIYMFWNVVGEIIWTAFLVTVGYYYGHLYITLTNWTWRAVLIASAGIIIYSVFWIRRKVKRRLEEI